MQEEWLERKLKVTRLKLKDDDGGMDDKKECAGKEAEWEVKKCEGRDDWW